MATAPELELSSAGALTVDADSLLVFGGDAVDRGAGSLRFLATLLSTDRSRVRWLAGNRDLNKMRLLFEVPPTERPAALRHIFKRTMGAPDAFLHRAAEIAAKNLPAHDEAVVESFLEDVRPGGLLFRYLERAELAIRVGPALFVHGAVTDESFLHVPGHHAPAANIDRWIAGLAAFYREEWARYAKGERPERLLEYQAPSRATPGRRDESVVYGRYRSANGNPELPSEETLRRLADEGIAWVFSGHTPTGDAPICLRGHGVTFVMADGSQARRLADVVLSLEKSELRVRCSVTADDERVAHPLEALLGTTGDLAPMGQRLPDGFLVRGVIDDGRWFAGKTVDGKQLLQQLRAPL